MELRREEEPLSLPEVDPLSVVAVVPLLQVPLEMHHVEGHPWAAVHPRRHWWVELLGRHLSEVRHQAPLQRVSSLAEHLQEEQLQKARTWEHLQAAVVLHLLRDIHQTAAFAVPISGPQGAP